MSPRIVPESGFEPEIWQTGGVADGFAIEIARENGAVLVRARGEFDLAAVESAEREISAAEQDGPSTIIFDLGAVTFVDSSGLRVLLGAAERARTSGRRFLAARPTGQVDRLLEMTGCKTMLEVAAELPEPFDS